MTPTVFATTPILRNNDIESTFSYERTDSKQVDLCFYKEDETGPAELHINVCLPTNYPDYPSQFAKLSLAEARLLRDLLNRPEVQAVLGEE